MNNTAKRVTPTDPDPEQRAYRSLDNLALLAYWAQAESIADRGGTNIELEHGAWRALERIAREVREDIEILWGTVDETNRQLRRGR